MSTNSRKASFALALGAATLLAAPAHAGKTARVHLQAPVKLDNPAATDLDYIENYGKTALWSHDFTIPYSTLETEIKKTLDQTLLQHVGPSGKKKTETCTDPCPDVTWWIDYNTSFAFTQKNDPVLTKVGPSSDNRVKAQLTTRAKVRVHGTFHATADVPVPMPVGFIMEEEHIKVPFDLFVEVELKADAEVKLWPTMSVTGPNFTGKVIQASPHVEIGGQAAKLGAQFGMVIGATPFGLLHGGPIAFSTILAVIGDAAADKAEAAIEAKARKMIDEGFNEALGLAEQAVRDAVKPAVTQANQAKSKALTTTLPGVGKSIQDLTSSLGATMEVHTVTPNGGIALSGVMRMANAPGSSRVAGLARVSSRKCMYASVMGSKIPVGFQDINEQLDSKVGQSCSTAFSGVQLQRRGYRGADPQVALGSTAESRPTWTGNLGQAAFTGTMTKGDGYYQCAFEAENLPNTAILAMNIKPSRGSKIAAQYKDERILAQKVPGKTLVFDHDLDPVSSLIVGGAYGCSTGGGPRLTPSKLKEFKDMLDNCPQCFEKLQHGQEVILEMDEAKLGKTTIGQHVLQQAKAFSRGSKARGAAKRGAAKRGAAKRGATRAPAARRTPATRAPAARGAARGAAR